MYTDITFSTSSKSIAKDFTIKVEPTADKEKLFIVVKPKEFGHSINLFLTPDIAEDLAWNIQCAIRSLSEQVIDV